MLLLKVFDQFNRLADMKELPYPEEDLGEYDNKEGWNVNWAPTSIYNTRLNLEKTLKGEILSY